MHGLAMRLTSPSQAAGGAGLEKCLVACRAMKHGRNAGGVVWGMGTSNRKLHGIALFLPPQRRSAPGYELSLPSIARSVVTNSVAESIAVDPYITLLFWPVPAAPPAPVLFAHSCRLPYSL